ncbi:MAG TPA: protoporphyrinogen oxidase [Polyangiaceae bacterium]|nr:protoporphyrinogen oxidase [Polyangiaceae bacterium]
MRVCVVGGGITGLSAAYRLVQRGADVTLYEGAQRPGGLLGTERFDGFVMETGPDSILSEKPWALALAEELGLGAEIIRTEPGPRGAYIVHAGKLERVPEGFSLMAPTDFLAMARSPIVSLRGKLRMAAEPFLPRRDSTADESLESYVVRRLGRETFERLAQPLVSGIYGAEPSKLSLAATMPRFLAMEREHGSVIRGLKAKKRDASQPGVDIESNTAGARYGLFAAFRGGMQALIDALARALGERVQLGHMVTALARDPDGLSVEVKGAWHGYDAVLIALPAHVAGQVLYGLNPPLAHKLFEIEYASAVTVTFGYTRADIAHPLDAYGFVVPALEGRRIIASTWASAKYAGRAPADKALIRVFIGGHKGQHLMGESDASLTEIARRELSALLGIERAPEWSRLVRYPRAMPQYHVGHLTRVAELEALVARESRLELAGNAYRGVGIPDAVRSAEQAVERLLGRS